MPHTAFAEPLRNAQQAALAAGHDFFRLGLDSLEKYSTHSLSSLKGALHEEIDGSRQLFAAADPAASLAAQGALAQPRISGLIAYWRGIYEISTAGRAALRSFWQQQQTIAGQQLQSAIDLLANSGKASESAVAAVRSAVNAASTVIDQARQVADLAEAGVDAAADAAASAIAASPARSRKAA